MKLEIVFEVLPGIVVFVLGLACAGCATGGIETASYSVEEAAGDFEVRAYEPQVVAETLVGGTLEEAGNAGFRRLFRYISGGNRSKTKIAMTAPVGLEEQRGEKIAMTAPVSQQAAPEGRSRSQRGGQASSVTGNQWTVTFMMPSSYSMETLPEPSDESVRLRAIPARRMAAVRYSGRWTQRRYARNLARLQTWMAERGFEAAGEPVWARYNAPFTPWFMRRNEVLIPLADQ
jgi:hypothetical protein